MSELNLHHLRYFRAAAREGGVTAAAAALHVSQPTVSAQIRKLEARAGTRLFHRTGRTLVLSDAGRVVARYADEIFALEEELIDYLDGRRATTEGPRLRIGVTDVVPKLVAHRILEPALDGPEGEHHLVGFEGKPGALFAQLAAHALDAVVSDSPVGPQHNLRAYNHLLGECGSTFFAPRGDAARLAADFPDSLDGTPCFLPTGNTSVRRELDHWFARQDVRPRVIGEFEDSALLKVFGQRGRGFFTAPSVIEDEVVAQYGAAPIGRVDELRERFYLVSVERRVRNPAIATLLEAARGRLFA